MGKNLRWGKTNQALIAVFPAVLILSGVMVYSAYKWFVPDAFSVVKSRRAEALVVLDGFSCQTKKGLPIPQTQSLRRGGSSRLIISHPAPDGKYLLVSGPISAGYMIEKIPLDTMLHLEFSSSQIRVESGGEEIAAVVMVPRTETTPLVVDAPSMLVAEGEVPPMPFDEDGEIPRPAGAVSGSSFNSDNGMSVQYTGAVGQSGTISLGDVAQLQFTLDESSRAWVEMPRKYRIQHQAVGTSDLEIGILIPQNPANTEPFEIYIFGEKVASVRPRLGEL